MNDETHDYVNELEGGIKTYDEYISNLQKENKKWKEGWESAEKRCGELQRELKGQRELYELEIGEWKEKTDQLRKLLSRCDYIFGIYKVDKEDVRDRFDSTLFEQLAEEL